MSINPSETKFCFPTIAEVVDCPDTTFATIQEETIKLYPDGDKHKEFLLTDKEDGWKVKLGESDYQEFRRLDAGVHEFGLFIEIREAINSLSGNLPQGSIPKGFTTAAIAKIAELAQTVTEVRQGRRQDMSLDQAYDGLRMLGLAFSAIDAALGGASTADGVETFAWFQKADRFGPQDEGYSAAYNSCIDSIELIPDSDDLDGYFIEKTHHYSGAVEININPNKRIEFAYTPDDSKDGAFHVSHSSSIDNKGRIRHRNNTSLSIRLALDDKSPVGISLSIGRSPHTSATFNRTGDLIGNLFQEISDNACHSTTGLTETMAREFKYFAERLIVQQRLQNVTERSLRGLGSLSVG